MHLARPSAAALALLLTAGSARAQPPLPRLTVELYPPAARDHIGRAYRNAQSHPDDAAAAGALARVVQAWEQWEAAHQAYAKAQALAPKTFDWHYLDAVVLQRLARHGEAAAQLAEAVSASPTYLPARKVYASIVFCFGSTIQ